jgi:hypothetical protein
MEESDFPEEIKSNSLDLLKLKELHEKVLEPLTKKRRRKQKEEKNQKRLYHIDPQNDAVTTAPPDSNVDLDPSILNSLDGEDDEQAQDDIEDEENPPAFSVKKIDSKTRRSKRIGDFDVKVLNKAGNPNQDLLKNYKISNDVSAFENIRFSGRNRVKFANFLSQKKAQPSKLFS